MGTPVDQQLSHDLQFNTVDVTKPFKGICEAWSLNLRTCIRLANQTNDTKSKASAHVKEISHKIEQRLREHRVRLYIWFDDCGVLKDHLERLHVVEAELLCQSLRDIFKGLDQDLRIIFHGLQNMNQRESKDFDESLKATCNCISKGLRELARLQPAIQMEQAIQELGPQAAMRKQIMEIKDNFSKTMGDTSIFNSSPESENVDCNKDKGKQRQSLHGEELLSVGLASSPNSESHSDHLDDDQCKHCRNWIPFHLLELHEETCSVTDVDIPKAPGLTRVTEVKEEATGASPYSTPLLSSMSRSRMHLEVPQNTLSADENPQYPLEEDLRRDAVIGDAKRIWTANEPNFDQSFPSLDSHIIAELLDQTISLAKEIQLVYSRVANSKERLSGRTAQLHIARIDLLLQEIQLVQQNQPLQTPYVEAQIKKLNIAARVLHSRITRLTRLEDDQTELELRQRVISGIKGSRGDKDIGDAFHTLDLEIAILSKIIEGTHVGISENISDGLFAQVKVIEETNSQVKQVLGAELEVKKKLESLYGSWEGRKFVEGERLSIKDQDKRIFRDWVSSNDHET